MSEALTVHAVYVKVLHKSQASHTPLSPLNWAGFFWGGGLLLTVDYNF